MKYNKWDHLIKMCPNVHGDDGTCVCVCVCVLGVWWVGPFFFFLLGYLMECDHFQLSSEI